MNTKRKLFCEISPLTYKISVLRCQFIRHLKNLLTINMANSIKENLLPYTIYKHSSLIRRELGDVDPILQDNKAINLTLAAPKI